MKVAFPETDAVKVKVDQPAAHQRRRAHGDDPDRQGRLEVDPTATVTSNVVTYGGGRVGRQPAGDAEVGHDGDRHRDHRSRRPTWWSCRPPPSRPRAGPELRHQVGQRPAGAHPRDARPRRATARPRSPPASPPVTGRHRHRLDHDRRRHRNGPTRAGRRHRAAPADGRVPAASAGRWRRRWLRWRRRLRRGRTLMAPPPSGHRAPPHRKTYDAGELEVHALRKASTSWSIAATSSPSWARRVRASRR